MLNLKNLIRNNIKIVNLDDNNAEVPLPNIDEVIRDYESSYDRTFPSIHSFGGILPKMAELPPTPVFPSIVLGSSAPLPGDYISIGDNVYKVEQRYYRLDKEDSWIELWVREENKQ